MAPRPKQRLDHVRDAIRLTHDSRPREEAYVTWITRDMCFHDTCHPKEMEAAEIEVFFDPPRGAAKGRRLHPKPSP